MGASVEKKQLISVQKLDEIFIEEHPLRHLNDELEACVAAR